MSSFHINGKTIDVPSGCSVSIINDVVYVNGLPHCEEKLTGIVKIIVEGSITKLDAKIASIEVHGNVNSINCGGSCTVHGFTGSIDAGGSVNCGDVHGPVNAGGSVNCGKVTGDIDAGGSVIHGN